ncbi:MULTISPECIES: hypothetical protein [unclassified Arthrobacter]|uniref:hypothetical protein n=1 Tax=unclassified Arthrobacter TaxID=235627 RepID=UPI0021073C62|nr:MULTISPECIES: hypothetical protein [unclassified Arthrobacter]MCQ1946383.1 hypothetical protein [Arthrobacter sp. zg-Y1116]MCQ1986323.1 hypothetical protein [Arthrobacter sp. zg-Y844]
MATSSSSVPPQGALPHGGLRRGARAMMVFFNVLYLCAAPVFWFFWTQRSAFALPAWAETAAGFASGPMPALAFAAAWAAAGILFGRDRRQAGAEAFNSVCALGALAAASGMLALVSAGLDG